MQKVNLGLFLLRTPWHGVWKVNRDNWVTVNKRKQELRKKIKTQNNEAGTEPRGKHVCGTHFEYLHEQDIYSNTRLPAHAGTNKSGKPPDPDRPTSSLRQGTNVAVISPLKCLRQRLRVLWLSFCRETYNSAFQIDLFWESKNPYLFKLTE